MMAEVFAPATTANLGPGFDVFGAALDLEAGFLVREGAGGYVWPEGLTQPPGRNLFLAAFSAAFAARGAAAPEVCVEVSQMLPLRSGLGSSASAICAGLTAAGLFLERPLAVNEALRIAAGIEGHPDNVAACLMGGVTIASGVQDPIVRRLPAPPLRAIALYPGGATSTPSARAALPRLVAREDAVHNVGRASLLVYALIEGDYALLREATADRLHEEQRLDSCDWCGVARDAAFAAGALAMPVSGSGPTMLALARPADAPAVLRALAPFAAGRPDARIWDLAFSNHAARSRFL